MSVETASQASGRSTLLAVSALIANSFIWGVSWWPMRHLRDAGLHPLWAIALIYLVVVICLSVARPAAWRGLKEYPQLALLALGVGVTNLSFNWAITVGDVVRVVLLFYLMPAWSVLVAWALLGEKPTAGSLLRLLLAMAGVLVVLKTPESPWPLPHGWPDWLAILGGLGFAVTNALLRKYAQARSDSRMLAMFGGSGFMALAVALIGMSSGQLPGPALASGAIPVVLGLTVAFMLSNAALQYGAARLAASTTAIVMLTEILFASVSSVLLGAGAFTPQILIGGSLIVLAAALSALAPSVKSAH